MAVNKSHPRYVEYIQKCQELIERGKREEQALVGNREEAPLVELHKRYAKKLSELQKEYAYLFEEGSLEDTRE